MSKINNLISKKSSINNNKFLISEAPLFDLITPQKIKKIKGLEIRPTGGKKPGYYDLIVSAGVNFSTPAGKEIVKEIVRCLQNYDNISYVDVNLATRTPKTAAEIRKNLRGGAQVLDAVPNIVADPDAKRSKYDLTF